MLLLLLLLLCVFTPKQNDIAELRSIQFLGSVHDFPLGRREGGSAIYGATHARGGRAFCQRGSDRPSSMFTPL